eukprot:GHRQ01020944.1.p1 GENE.GHRQ01020944.1~~GHRQ01020944.1.p1  ORF type:complete len:269 (+),score=118.93 GHRQ01020944.1:830-1636(+)
MGNCFGKSSAQRRHDNWKATGIVVSRDGGLCSIPSNVLAIAGTVRTLDVSNNAISDLAEQDLQGFSQLQRLVLAGNRSRQLPRSICTLSQLKHLALDSNKLMQLPAELGQLQRLEVLLLQGNQLTALPDALGSCKALKTLSVSRNRLAALPHALGGCSSLQELDVSSNHLSSLPVSLGSLSKLKVLQADANSIAAVPGELLQGCGELHTLSLHSNPITPAELEGTAGYREYDARRRGKYDKVLAGGALLGSAGLDDGLDRLLKAPSPN